MMFIRNIKIILFIVIVTILLWLLVLDFVPGEKLEINYDFCSQKQMITGLSPGNRLWPIKKIHNDCLQEIAISPVYFDTRVPQYFNFVEVEVKYKKPDSEVFQIGPQIAKDEWIWMLQDIKHKNLDGDWEIGVAKFDLLGVYQSSTVMRWLISAPTIEENKNVVAISNIKITFYKDRLNFANFLGQFKNYLRKIVR
ncbi:MAG: hypothetical protein ABIF17_01805 [Patescibacteria group bacterium]